MTEQRPSFTNNSDRGGDGGWLLLVYWVPRSPAGPRMAAWRTMQRLGVLQLADGTVALPATNRTEDSLRVFSSDVLKVGGRAFVWRASLDSHALEQEFIERMVEPLELDYRSLVEDANAVAAAPVRLALRRLQRRLERIEARDHFMLAERDAARRAVRRVALAAEYTDQRINTKVG